MKCYQFLLLVPLSVCLAACGSSAGGSNTSAPSPTPGPHHLGEAITVPGWKVTINSLKLTLQNGTTVPTTSSDMVLLLEVTLQNTSSHSATASDSPFACHGADGAPYARIAAGTSSLAGPVAAGSTAMGQVAFEVPIGTHQFNVFYEDPYGSTLATWQLSVSPTQ